MPVQKGKVVLRASLDEALIIDLAEAALRLFLSDAANLEALIKRR